jgi:hypothetical protein
MHRAQRLMKSADGSVAGGLALLGMNETEQEDMIDKITLDNGWPSHGNGWPSHGRLLKRDAS